MRFISGQAFFFIDDGPPATIVASEPRLSIAGFSYVLFIDRPAIVPKGRSATGTLISIARRPLALRQHEAVDTLANSNGLWQSGNIQRRFLTEQAPASAARYCGCDSTAGSRDA